MKKLIAAALFVVACGDDAKPNNPDAAVDVDAAIDAAPPMWTKPSANALGISAAGHDVIMSAVAGPNGGFYAVGYHTADTASAKEIIVIKLLATGLLDTTWATGGVLDTNIVFTGATDELDIETFANGDLLVSATVAADTINALDAADTDIALIKITAAGALDTNFGGGDGIIKHSFNTSILTTGGTPAPIGRDGVRSLDVRDNGEIFVFAYQRGEGDQTGMTGVPRVDTDFVIAKFTSAGALDTAGYGNGTGKYVRDIYLNSAHSNATPRGLTVVGNGIVIAGGYADTTPATGTPGPQPVLIRLLADGTPDTNFATGGLYHETLLSLQTEVYEIAIHGSKIVTGGYGRNTGELNDYISLRFDLATGVRDTTWGGASATDGLVVFDPTPANAEGSSNCRGTIALPDGKTMLLGSASRSLNSTATPDPAAQDAVFAILDADGKLDTGYGTGIATYALGPDGQDAFWGAAVNGTNVLLVGWKSTVGTASATNNDDAYSVILPIE